MQQSRAFKIIKWCTLVFILGNVLIIFTDNHHIYRALMQTVFRGTLSPPVEIQWQFDQRKVPASEHPQALPTAINYNKTSLSKEHLAFHKSMESLSFLVLHKGEIILEQYWDMGSDTSHTNSWSMAKSVIGLLIGIANDEGHIKSLQDPVIQYAPTFKGGNKVRIIDLLSMSSGLGFNENYVNPFAHPARALYGNHIEKLSLDVKAANPPGKQFEYLSGNTQILAAILKKATGTTVSDYFYNKLWNPLGAEQPAYWSLDQKGGDERAFCCLHSNARDFARLGLLINQKGNWKGKQLVSENYIEKAFTPLKLTNEEGEPLKKYGLHFWMAEINGVKINYARGINGQYILCMPDKDLVVVRLGRQRASEYKEGHPTDVFNYAQMGLDLVKGKG